MIQRARLARGCRFRAWPILCSNELIVPLGKKDYWNKQHPKDDSQFANYVNTSRTAGLIPVLLPGRIPKPGNAQCFQSARADLAAILLTACHPDYPWFPELYIGNTQADVLRLKWLFLQPRAHILGGAFLVVTWLVSPTVVVSLMSCKYRTACSCWCTYPWECKVYP